MTKASKDKTIHRKLHHGAIQLNQHAGILNHEDYVLFYLYFGSPKSVLVKSQSRITSDAVSQYTSYM